MRFGISHTRRRFVSLVFVLKIFQSYFLSNKETCDWCAFIVKGLKAIAESRNSSRIDDKVMAMKLPFMLKMVTFRLLIIEFLMLSYYYIENNMYRLLIYSFGAFIPRHAIISILKLEALTIQLINRAIQFFYIS